MKNNVIYVDFIFSHKKVSYINYRFTSAFYSLFNHLKEHLKHGKKIPKKSLSKKDSYKVSNHLKL